MQKQNVWYVRDQDHPSMPDLDIQIDFQDFFKGNVQKQNMWYVRDQDLPSTPDLDIQIDF